VEPTSTRDGRHHRPENTPSGANLPFCRPYVTCPPCIHTALVDTHSIRRLKLLPSFIVEAAWEACVKMVTQVLIAHTGQRLELDSRIITSLHDLKESVASQSSIPVECLIALTPQGRSLRWQPTQPETEIYVYDSRLTQRPQPGTSPPPISDLPFPRYNAPNPPNSIEDTRSVPAWQKLFETRRAWAFDVVEDCARMDAATRERYAEMDVMLRCLDAAVANLENAVKGLENKYVELKEWSTSAQADHSALATGLDRYLSLVRTIAISSTMAQFMTCRDGGGWKKVHSDKVPLKTLSIWSTRGKQPNSPPLLCASLGIASSTWTRRLLICSKAPTL